MDKKARRAQLIAEMREMNEKLLSEKRDFTDEERKRELELLGNS